MRKTGKRVCCVLLSAALITGGLPGGTGAVLVPGHMTARAEAGPETLESENAMWPEAEKATPSEIEKATPSLAMKAEAMTLSRILMEESFDNGDGWNVNQPAAVTFTGGQGVIKGGGPNNRMGSKMKIPADDFLLEADFMIGAGNTNSNAKFGFKAAEGYDGDRLQLRFDFPKNKVFLERNGGTVYQSVNIMAFNQGKYKIAIEVSGRRITAYLDGEEIIAAEHDEIAQMERGYIVISGQYPAQDFAVDNLVVSTDEAPQGEEYTVTLKTFTDGVEDPAGTILGGTLGADRLTGYSGDTITLETKAKHGYVFDHYASWGQDGTPTDGLMPIINHKFQLNEKFGNVTVAAYFKTREPGKDEIFFDGFGAELNDNGQYGYVKDPGRAEIVDEELILDAQAGESNCILVSPGVFDQLAISDGWRISVDVRRAGAGNGTFQIAFAGRGQAFDDRYVVAVNSQGSAMFRRFKDGKNDELKRCAFELTSAFSHMEIEVNNGKAALLIDGSEKMVLEDTDKGWSGMEPGTGLFNMSAGAPVVFDNLMIERIPRKKAVEVVSVYNGEVDSDHKTGVASANMTEASEGDQIKLSSAAKAGYRLKEYQVEGFSGLVAADNTFIVPAGDYETLRIMAVFEAVALRDPQAFYIDSETGDDTAAGTSKTEAWKTLGKLKQYGTFVPGDRILLKRESVFREQQLVFDGMGSKERPIEIGAYGEGELPRLDGGGKVENVISLFNQEYITISDLEITNLASGYQTDFGLNTSNNRSKAMRAINVSIKNFGTASGISITDCYIHDINGNIGLKWNGGIFFDVQADIQGGKLTGVPSKYDDVMIAGCTFERVDRSGIKLVSSSWCNQWEKNSPGVPVNWYPSTNVVVRNNYMEKIGGDGITVRDTDGALIEHNLVRDCRYQNTGYNVGIWPFEAANTVIQYNEAYDTHSVQDGQGLDCDHASSNSIMQYNYSHNNEGGFMLIMGGYPHTGATIRYNVSQNDRDKAFEFAQGCPNGTMIYQNTIYSDRTIPKGVFYLSNTGAGLGVNEIYAFNNVFQYPEGQVFYGDSGDTAKLKDSLKLYNNAYIGGMEAPDGDAKAIKADSAGMTAPGTAPEINQTKQPVTGSSGKLDGYKLTEGSVLIDAGVTMQEAIAYFGGGEPVDGRKYSPRELYEEAKSGRSIDYVVGLNFPEIDGVEYNRDFFGNENLAGERPDMGAMEFAAKAPANPDTPENPSNPETPETPSNPETPSSPDNPGTPDNDNPANPDTPNNSDTPNNPADSSSSGQDSSVLSETGKNSSDSIRETTGNWVRLENGWSLRHPDGTPYRSTWVYKGEQWYWVGEDGMMAEDWKYIDGSWYYFTPRTGALATGWIRAGERWYYLDENGRMLADTVTPDGYRVDNTGAWTA